ncbi:DNA-binding transcriptional LysR family regulator [Sphingomonas zeicaulis]
MLAKLARRYPNLHIHACYSDRFVDLVAEGFDCGIRCGHLEDSSLIARRIGPIVGKLVATPEYIDVHGAPETPNDILQHDVTMQSTETWQFMHGEKIVRIRPNGRFKADNGASLVSAALEGIGIAYVPEKFVEEHIRSGALLEIMTRHPIPPAGMFVVRPPSQHPARKVRILTELLIETFGGTEPGAHAL